MWAWRQKFFTFELINIQIMLTYCPKVARDTGYMVKSFQKLNVQVFYLKTKMRIFRFKLPCTSCCCSSVGNASELEPPLASASHVSRSKPHVPVRLCLWTHKELLLARAATQTPLCMFKKKGKKSFHSFGWCNVIPHPHAEDFPWLRGLGSDLHISSAAEMIQRGDVFFFF